MDLKKHYLTLPMLIYLAVDVLICIACAIVLFAVPAYDNNSACAWTALLFAGPVSIIASFWMIRYIGKNEQTRLLKYNAVNSIGSGYGTAYCLVFIASMIIPLCTDEEIIPFIIVLVIDIIITIAYAYSIFSALFSTAVLDAVNEDQRITIETKKSNYIPELSAMIGASVPLVSDVAIQAQLASLRAAIDVSPQMSPPGAVIIEDELKALCSQIVNFIAIPYLDQVPQLIAKANAKLMERNLKCNNVGAAH